MGQRAGIYVDYFVVEVSIDINDFDPILNAETMTRLLQIKGFRVADFEYLTPSADKKPPYQPAKAKLLLHSTTATRIARSKLIAIVEAMHDGLYKNWYRPFAQDFEGYCAHLRDIQRLLECHLGNKEYVALNGHPPSSATVEITDFPRAPVLALYVALAVTLAIIVAAITSWLQISLRNVLSGVIVVSICMLAVLALWFDSAARLLRYGIDALVSLFGKRR